MITCKTPQTCSEFEAYYAFRWQLLRKAWSQPKGSEQDELEGQAHHRMIVGDANVNGELPILAVGRLHKTHQHQAQIRFMAVAKDQQGNGLGRRIIDALEHEAIRQGVTTITLKARENALGFYQRLGYVNQGLSHTLYGVIKHFTLVKSLKPLTEHQKLLALELQHKWHHTIPLSKAMNIEISYYDQHELLTNCDESFNKNLHNTMFAGSIYTLATLTGWAWVYMQLKHQELEGNIVLADANIRYHQPIKGPTYAKTTVEQVSGDLSELVLAKKARLKIDVHLYCGEKLAATFNGLYVVLP
jgi:thioesterase domain-containing protein